MDFFVFGLSHNTAPVDVRERWAVAPGEAQRTLESISSSLSASEHVILSTCNRTEFYCHVPRALSPLQSVESAEEQRLTTARFYRDAMRGARSAAGGAKADEDPAHFYLHRHQDAVEHLFRLAGGLESMIVGESEILRQIKDAYGLARRTGATGRLFQRLFPDALRLGKRVRHVTGISLGCITPGQAALRLARQTLGDLEVHGGLVLGSGKIAKLTARAFVEEGVGCFTVVNRTHARAHELLEELRRRTGRVDGGPIGVVRRWEELEEALAATSLVITSTGATEPVISTELLARVQTRREFRPLVVIDLAIPRDVDPDAGAVAGVKLFNIDDLNKVIQENIERRHHHVPAAEDLVQAETKAFFGRMAYLQIDPVIRHLVDRFEEIRLGQLQSVVDLFPPQHHKALDELTRALVKKLLHFPIERLKSLRDVDGLGDREAAFLRRLFLTDSIQKP